MQEQDVISKEYFLEEARVADFINGYFFCGEQLVKPEDIREVDSSFFGRLKWFGRWTVRHRYRDIIRRVQMGMRFALVGIEEQNVIHFSMPVRAMGYDFLSYDRQIKRIQKKHNALRDLQGKAQFLSKFTPQDLLEPTVTVVLYYGEEPWNGPTSLKDMLKLSDFPEAFQGLVNDYPLHIFEVNRFPNLNYFKTDLRLVFGFLQNRSDQKKLRHFIEVNESELQEIEDDAYDMIAVMSHSEELGQMKKKFQKGRKIDMCRALKEWMEDSKQEGYHLGIERGLLQGSREGEARFARLTEKLLLEARSDELLKAAGDEAYRENLYKEMGL